MNLKERAKRLKAEIPALFIALGDSETPAAAKVLAGIAVAYALSPVDLIPDFIPVLGYLDDLILLPGMIALALKLIPPAVWQRSLERAEGMWPDGRPKRWYYALPVIALWLLLVWLIVRAIVY